MISERMEQQLFKSKKRVVTRSSSKFNTKSIDYTFVTNRNDNVYHHDREKALTSGRMWIQLIFQAAIEYNCEKEEITNTDQISVLTNGGDLMYHLVIPYHAFHSPKHQYNALMDHIARVQQS